MMHTLNEEMEQTDTDCNNTFTQCGESFFLLILQILKGNPEGETEDEKIKMRKHCQYGEIIPLLSDAVSGIYTN